MNIDGLSREASASYIIRDFETESFEKRKDLMKSIADQMNAELGSERVLPHPQRSVLQHEASD